MDEDFPGTTRFSLTRRLGEGSFGVVYEAYDRARNALVALKVLRHSDAAALYRFKQEFRSLADVIHPNLARLYELLSEGQRWFFTMELVNGLSFLEYMRPGVAERPPSSPPDPLAVTLPAPGRTAPDAEAHRVATAETGDVAWDRLDSAFAQLVRGVCALHDAGKLHRDIKPSNVLVTREGRVVLLDFGLVTDVGRPQDSASHYLAGTPQYMSPEQAAGLPLSEASDWFSVGVILYEALTGRVPFPSGVVRSMWRGEPWNFPAPAVLTPETPADLDFLCQSLLQRNPADRPTGSDLLLRWGGGSVVPRAPRNVPAAAGGTRLIGRQPHMAALFRAFEASKRGRAVLVRVQGKSGTGKTALIRSFLDQLVRHGEEATILSGRCFQQESVPYKALDSLVDALSHHLKSLTAAEVGEILPRDILALTRLFPVLRRVEAVASARRRTLAIPDSRELRRRAFAALRELLGRLAGRNPLVLFLDDLQWGDLDSALLILDVLRPPDPPPLLLLAAFRDEAGEASPFLGALQCFAGELEPAVDLQELGVEELDRRDSREFARILLAEWRPDTEELAERIARESGGNPFFIDVLARHARRGRDDPSRSPRTPSAREEITLEGVIQSRVARLTESGRRLLEVVAVAARPIEWRVARDAARLEGDEPAVLAELRLGHLLRSRRSGEQEEIETFHDRIREAVLTLIPPETLRDYHERLAHALDASGTADPEALAHHFRQSGDLDQAAGYAAAAAARAFDALAFDRAVRLFRLALELLPGSRPGRSGLRGKLAESLASAGRGEEAAEEYLRAAGEAAAADTLEFQRCAAEQYLISGHLEDGISTLTAVLGRVGMKFPRTRARAIASVLLRKSLLLLRGIDFRPREATRVSDERLTRIDVCWTAAVGLALVDPLRSRDFQGRHMLLALGAGEPYRVSRALTFEAGHSSTGGGRTRRRTHRLLAASRSLAEEIDNPHASGLALSVGATVAYLEGRFAQAEELAAGAEEILREKCRGVAWELDNAHYYGLLSLYYQGKLKEFCLRLPGLLKEALDRGDLYAVTNMRLRFSFLAALILGDLDKARTELSEGIRLWPRTEFLVQHWYEMVGAVETLLYDGDPGAALHYLAERWRPLARSWLMRVQAVRIHSRNLRAWCAIAASRESGPRAKLLRRAGRDARRMQREGMAWGNALSLMIRAGVASARGDTGEAVSRLEFAEDGFEAAGMALYRNVARRRRGELLGGAEGAGLVAAADGWMSEAGVVNPGRIAGMLAPFVRPD